MASFVTSSKFAPVVSGALTPVYNHAAIDRFAGDRCDVGQQYARQVLADDHRVEDEFDR